MLATLNVGTKLLEEPGAPGLTGPASRPSFARLQGHLDLELLHLLANLMVRTLTVINRITLFSNGSLKLLNRLIASR